MRGDSCPLNVADFAGVAGAGVAGWYRTVRYVLAVCGVPHAVSIQFVAIPCSAVQLAHRTDRDRVVYPWRVCRFSLECMGPVEPWRLSTSEAIRIVTNTNPWSVGYEIQVEY